MNFLAIALGGLLGVFSRYFISINFEKYRFLESLSQSQLLKLSNLSRFSSMTLQQFPLATLLINVLGSFLMGLVFQYSRLYPAVPEALRLGLSVGFLGGFTTFSTFSLETFRLLESAQYQSALIYLGLSNLLGLAALSLGVFLLRS